MSRSGPQGHFAAAALVETSQNHCRQIVSSLKCLANTPIDETAWSLAFRRNPEVLVSNLLRLAGAAAIASLIALPAKAPDITVGLVTSMTGPGASIGIPYAKGAAAGAAYKDEVDGTKLNLIQLDGATDPSI